MLEGLVNTEPQLHYLVGPNSTYHPINGRREFILIARVKVIVHNQSEQMRVRNEPAEETDGGEGGEGGQKLSIRIIT